MENIFGPRKPKDGEAKAQENAAEEAPAPEIAPVEA